MLSVISHIMEQYCNEQLKIENAQTLKVGNAWWLNLELFTVLSTGPSFSLLPSCFFHSKTVLGLFCS